MENSETNLLSLTSPLLEVVSVANHFLIITKLGSLNLSRDFTRELWNVFYQLSTFNTPN